MEDDIPPPVPPKPQRVEPPPMLRSNSDVPPVPPVLTPTPCCECEKQTVKTWKCVQCGYFFCDDCWPKQRPHFPGIVGYDGRHHEKVDEEVVHRLTQTFVDPTVQEQNLRHGADFNTTWFGVTKEVNGELSLNPTNRLGDIMVESRSSEYQSSERFPHLVSFVGQTGAGKSTIVKMLIHREHARIPQQDPVPVPVPGLSGDTVATTGDVHLYSDPGTYYSQKPMLYSDCEGLTGGEHNPRGLVIGQVVDSAKKGRNKLRKAGRKITWATQPRMQSREFAVANLFPRILYTFSDVVVFVLREARTFESGALTHLINWAAKSMSKSLNQPLRPHIVIVLNDTDVSIDEKLWDPVNATKDLLHHYKDSVHIPALRDHVASLEVQGKKPRNTKELMEYYYSSVTVVRIPTKGRYMKMDEQVGILQAVINDKCAKSHALKRSVRMLLNAERLPRYVDAAYEHFIHNPDTPFDFAAEARRQAPFPQDFGGHILNLITTIYDSAVKQTQSHDNSGAYHNPQASYQSRLYQSRAWVDNPVKIFQNLSRVVASCVILAATRDNTQGTYSDLLHSTYGSAIEFAYMEFCTKWLRCFFHKDGIPCVNVFSSHEKGHQSSTGKVLLSRASYESKFDFDQLLPVWMKDIDGHINQMNRELQAAAMEREEKTYITNLHRKEVSDAYKAVMKVSDLKSHATCFCCVRDVPDHILPCGHVLCKSCFQFFGKDVGQGFFDMSSCPLHPQSPWQQPPVRIAFKPQEAGVRSLCLDGGGVRGIVELVILEALQKQLEPIPVRDFFDLIVGTSTGGIIALGLGAKRWSIAECMQTFKALCKPAFTPRSFSSVLKPLDFLAHKSWYKTKTLESALKSAFGLELLFGGPRSQGSTSTRVAITSTSASDNGAVVLANYNRGEDARFPSTYRFERPRDSSSEFKIWQAARATSAAPMYFKPFVHEARAYADGAIRHNCPAFIADAERRLIWAEVNDWPPDFLLSLGTGFSEVPPTATTPTPTPNAAPSGSKFGFRSAIGLAFSIIDDQINCENIWSKYHGEATSQSAHEHGEEDGRRNMRINVPLLKRPSLDQWQEVENMERESRLVIQNNQNIGAQIHEAAHRLVASCFYFETSTTSSQSKGSAGYSCLGNVRCRFEEGSSNLKGLGKILHDQNRSHFMPHFVLQENYGSNEEKKHILVIPRETVEDMRDRGIFQLVGQLSVDSTSQTSVTRISLALQTERYDFSTEYYNRWQDNVEPLLSISGFPRMLYSQDSTLSTSHVDAAAEAAEPPSSNAQSSPLPPTPPPMPHAQTEPDPHRLRSKFSIRFSRRHKLQQTKNRWSDPQLTIRNRHSSETSSLVELPALEVSSARFSRSSEGFDRPSTLFPDDQYDGQEILE